MLSKSIIQIIQVIMEQHLKVLKRAFRRIILNTLLEKCVKKIFLKNLNFINHP